MIRRLKNLWKLSNYEPYDDRTFDLASIQGNIKMVRPSKKTILRNNKAKIVDMKPITSDIPQQDDYSA